MSHKKSFLSADTVKSSLKSHSHIALWFSALLYLICLSGSVAVFFEEFERLEQPHINEYSNFPAESIQPAIDEYIKRLEKSQQLRILYYQRMISLARTSQTAPMNGTLIRTVVFLSLYPAHGQGCLKIFIPVFIYRILLA